MPCPPGEGRSRGEDAEHSHWASIILFVAAPAPASFIEAGVLVSSSLATNGPRHAALQRDASLALQRRASRPQPELLRGLEPKDLRGLQQSQLPRPQLRAGAHRGGGGGPQYRVRHGPQSAEGPGPGAAAEPPGPQESE